MNDPIYLTRDGDVAEMVLNRPEKLNSMNQAIWQAIPRLVAEVAEDPALKVLIVRGATPKAFAAGADIAEFKTVHATEQSAHAYHQDIYKAFDALAGLAKPTIAQVQGICFGGGCALALCCDLRYADETAKFCIPPAKLGIAYSLSETKRLSDLVGPSKAKEMLMGARVLAADEALSTGLVTRLFPSADLARETRAYADELCKLSQYTIRAVKQIVGAIGEGATEDNELSRRLHRGAFESPDYQEGRDAFMEKRTPVFTYR